MERKKILIWGEAGVGKTTFCAKFCQDWALVIKENEGKGQDLTEEQKTELEKLTKEQRSKLNNIGLLFYIVLRDIGSKTVNGIIIDKLCLQKLDDSQLLSILRSVNECSRIVILMDGFDEISDKDGHVKEVLTERDYCDVHCIITCRPHATRGIFLKVDVEIRLKGFSEAQAKAFVKMYAKIKYKDKVEEIDFLSSQIVSQIESSAELLEMSTNPSMLQLLCLLSWKKGNIGKNRTSVFQDYTLYLLTQYHLKLGKTEESYSDGLYKKHLLNAGKVALMGLKKNQLNLVFSKNEARRIGGDEIFEIGFLTELPSTDTDSVKVQFTHKTLQEYLAAFYVVNTPGDEGLQLLMQFCSTSQRLMGSQIILEFISNMSTDILGRAVQDEIKKYVSKWDSDDQVNPRERTSFLISVLEGNETLKFPLPAVIDIDFREHSVYRQSVFCRFFNMDGQGVRKINLTLKVGNRLNVLQNTTINSLDELHIEKDWRFKSWSREDNEALHRVIKKMKPGLLSIKHCEWKLMEEATISVILQHVHTLILEKSDLEQEHLLSILKREHHLKSLKVKDSAIRIDVEVIEAMSKLSSNIKLDVKKETGLYNFGSERNFGNGEITLIHKSPSMKSMHMSKLIIDTGIAEGVPRLPEHIQLDLSGNKLTKMDPYLLPRVMLHMPEEEEIDMTGWRIDIDVDIVKALSSMPQLKSLKASNNKLTPEAVREFSMSELQQLDLSGCGINATVCVSLMICLSKHCPLLEVLHLDGNSLKSEEWCPHVQMKQLRELYLSKCGINDTVCKSLMISLSKHCPLLEVLNLGGNKLTSDEWCHHVKMKKLRKLYLSRCTINATVCVSLMICLSKHCPLLEVLHLDGNSLKSEEWCPHVQMKQLRELYLSKCGINGTVSKSLMIRLSEHCPRLEVLDLGGNDYLTSDVWCHHVQMKQLRELYLYNCDMDKYDCESLMINLSKHCPLLELLDLGGNNLTSSGLLEIVDHIKHMRKLRTLWLHNNPCMRNEKILYEAMEALQTSNPKITISKVF